MSDILDSKNYSKLIFLARMDGKRNRASITRFWEWSEQSRTIYRESATKQIEKLEEEGFVEEEKAKFNGKFQTYLESKVSESNPISGSIEEFCKLLDSDWFRKSVLTEENIKNFYNLDRENSEKGRERAKHNFLELFTTISISILGEFDIGNYQKIGNYYYRGSVFSELNYKPIMESLKEVIQNNRNKKEVQMLEKSITT